METEQWPLHSVERALLCMWSVNQDYATQLNGVGYNKLDSDFGNSLAEKLSKWGHLTFRQKAAAYKMLKRYRRQLMVQWGIDWDLIPEPVENEPQAKVKGQVRLSDRGELIFDSPYNPTLKNALQVMPTRRWDASPKLSLLGQKGVWIVAISIDNFKHLNVVLETFDLEISDEAKAAIENARQHLESMVEGSKSQDADIEIEGLGVELLPFQKATVAFARQVLKTGGMYDANEMGLGKTVENLAIAQDQNLFPHLVGVPNVVWLNWGTEALKVLPGRRTVLLAPRSLSVAERRAVPEGVSVAYLDSDDDNNLASLIPKGGGWYDVYVVTYDNLLKWSPALLEVPWKLVTYDEAHLLKERKAKRTQAAAQLAKVADSVILMSGTPTPNAPAELITQFNMLDRMDDLGGFKRYWWRYCQSHSRGHANLEELNAKMRSTFYRRITKAEVYPELPAVRWIPVPVKMRNPERYDEIEADLLRFIQEKVERDADLAALLSEIEDIDAAIALKKEVVDERYERSMRARVLATINACRQVAAEEKFDAFTQWMDSWLATATDKKMIVFTYHREIGEATAERYSAPLIYGGMDKGKKKLIEQDFQENPATRVLVCAIKAAGLGLTLTAASDVAFLEYDWRPLDMDQAVSRTYGRVNDLHGATAYEIRASGTIDDLMLDRIAQKRDVTGKVSDGGSIFGEVMRDLLGKVEVPA